MSMKSAEKYKGSVVVVVVVFKVCNGSLTWLSSWPRPSSINEFLGSRWGKCEGRSIDMSQVFWPWAWCALFYDSFISQLIIVIINFLILIFFLMNCRCFASWSSDDSSRQRSCNGHCECWQQLGWRWTAYGIAELPVPQQPARRLRSTGQFHTLNVCLWSSLLSYFRPQQQILTLIFPCHPIVLLFCHFLRDLYTTTTPTLIEWRVEQSVNFVSSVKGKV